MVVSEAADIIQERAVRHVSKDCLVAFETNRYSVPFRLAGQRVEVQTDGDMLKVFHNGELVSSHVRLFGSFQSQVDKSHYWGIFKPAKPSLEPQDDVQIRDLAVYENLLGGGVL